MTSRNSRSWVFLLLLLGLCTRSFTGTTGKLAGRVTDRSTGEGLPGANVVLAGTSLGAVTDADGYYAIINLPPGSYDLVISLMGYARFTIQGAKVNIDRTTTQNAQLTAKTLQGQEVTVMAERPVMERDLTSTASYTDAETIQDLPVTSMTEVIQLQAGVVAGAGGELHFRGGREREVAYMIDGVPVNNAYAQTGGNNVAVENAIIKELQVISGTFNAEYGSAQSGIVNIVTKAPEKQWHGSLQIYSGDFVSNKTNVFIGIDRLNPIAEGDFQATLTGPLAGHKLGVLLTTRYNRNESLYWYERRFRSIDGWVIDAYRKWYNDHYASEIGRTGEIRIPDSLRTGDGSMGPLSQGQSLTFSGKLIYAPSSNLSLTYSLFASGSQGESGGLNRRYAPDGLSRYWSRADNHFINIRHMLHPNLFYHVNASYQHNHSWSYYRRDNKVADYPGDMGIQPITSTSNGFSLGTTDGGFYGKDGKNYQKIYTANGNINWQVDRHNFIKLGFEIKRHAYNTYNYPLIETEEWQRYKYTTAIRGAKLSWKEYWTQMVDYWKNWDETYGTSKYRLPRAEEITRYRDYTIKPLEAAFYLQDKLEMGEIVLNAGVRLDMFKANEKYIVNERIESYLLGSEQNLKRAPIQYQLNPRLGFSFPISDRGAFHVAYGHFFQMPSFATMYSEPLQVLTPLQLQGQLLGNCTLKPERTIAYEVGLQQGLTDDLAADLTLFYKDFRNQLGIEYITTVDAIGYTRYVNRDYGNVKGFTLALEKLRRGWFSGGVDYTFQYGEGSASDPTFLQLVQVSSRLGGDPVQFVERQIVPLDWDQRHTLNLTAIFSQPGHWSASIIGTLGSGLPYTPSTVGQALFPDIEFNNAARKPMRWNIDLKAKKQFRVGNYRFGLFCNIDNLFDHLNQQSVYATSGLASVNAMLPELREIRDERLAQEGVFTPQEIDNRPHYYSPPRHVQLGMEVQF